MVFRLVTIRFLQHNNCFRTSNSNNVLGKLDGSVCRLLAVMAVMAVDDKWRLSLQYNQEMSSFFSLRLTVRAEHTICGLEFHFSQLKSKKKHPCIRIACIIQRNVQISILHSNTHTHIRLSLIIYCCLPAFCRMAQFKIHYSGFSSKSILLAVLWIANVSSYQIPHFTFYALSFLSNSSSARALFYSNKREI